MSIKKWVVAWFLCAVSVSAWAGTIKVKGMSHVPYGGWSGVDAKVRAEALKKAELNALDRYVANTNGAEERNYAAIRSRIAQHISRYVLSTSTISSFRNKKTKMYTLVISADLNVYQINDALQANSAVANTSQSQRSYITFIFVARQQSRVTSFGNQTAVRIAATTTANGAMQTMATHSGQSYTATNEHVNGMDTAAQNQNQQDYASSHHRDQGTHATGHSQSQGTYGVSSHAVLRVTSRSHVIRKANMTQYRVRRSGTVNDVISNILSQAGYQVVDAKFIATRTHNLLNVAAFKRQFGRGNDISQTTLANAATAAQEVHVPYLAYGTLDVGIQDVDPATGLKRVYVEVTAKVYNLSGMFPVTVAAVGPVQYAGLGPNAAVARTNGLKLAATKAAEKLVAEMDVKGVQ